MFDFLFCFVLFRVRCSTAGRLVSYFPPRCSWQGRGEVGQGHVGVDGLVKDKGRGDIIHGFNG